MALESRPGIVQWLAYGASVYCFFFSSVRAVGLGYVKILSYEKYIARIESRKNEGLGFPPKLVKWRLDEDSIRGISDWQRIVASDSWSLTWTGCVGRDSTRQCMAPRTSKYPFFPLTSAQRNAMIQRPAPSEVRSNIRQATGGELSEVHELVERVIQNIHNLNALRDDELALVASNFHNATNGWILSAHDLDIDCQEWPADLLLPGEEAKALMAAFLHVLTDSEFRDRGEAQISSTHNYEAYAKTKAENGRRVYATCHAKTKDIVRQFISDVTELEKEVILSDEEWLRQYEWQVAKLRAVYYAMAKDVPPDMPDGKIASVEELVAAAEEVADAETCGTIEGLGRETEAFRRYFKEQQLHVIDTLGHLRESLMYRLIWRRWQRLTSNIQAGYDYFERVADQPGMGGSIHK